MHSVVADYTTEEELQFDSSHRFRLSGAGSGEVIGLRSRVASVGSYANEDTSARETATGQQHRNRC